jgi:CPA2 family monovalent cation:H+ antiporter-2/glutathione-regulated potassium-efflux system protein KefB
MLETLAILLGATVLAVPISRRLGFGSILGYLVAGVVIGPSGLQLVTDVQNIARVSDLGVVMLLFLIGLEVQPHRLWVLRKTILGLGLGQLVPTAALLTLLARLSGVPGTGAIVLGLGLALSSTAIVLPMLNERKLLSSPAGRDSFAVLLFQDMAFIPLVALVPLLSGDALPVHVHWQDIARGVAAIAVILVGGSILVRPIFRIIGGAHTPEVFTATALLLVVGTAALAEWSGLSTSLGAFMAGVILSESEYRHEIQADIEPFKGLLLGFFFISVGMSADLGLVVRQPVAIVAMILVLILAKVAAAFPVGLVKRRSVRSALRFSLALPEGSEFSFVLFSAAVASGVLGQADADTATVVVAGSMLVTPVLFAAAEWLIVPRLERPREPVHDRIDEPPAEILICGFGRMGQIVGRILRMQKIPFIALDKSPEQVEVVRRFGSKVYLGNPAREEVMRAAGADAARILVVALDDMDEALRVVDMARRHFPHLSIVARARNRHHAHLLMDRGLQGIVRETFFSSLRLAELVLGERGIAPETAHRAIEIFQAHDEQALVETQVIAHDESKLIQSTQEAGQELQELFEADTQDPAVRPRQPNTSAPRF